MHLPVQGRQRWRRDSFAPSLALGILLSGAQLPPWTFLATSLALAQEQGEEETIRLRHDLASTRVARDVADLARRRTGISVRLVPGEAEASGDPRVVATLRRIATEESFELIAHGPEGRVRIELPKGGEARTATLALESLYRGPVFRERFSPRVTPASRERPIPPPESRVRDIEPIAKPTVLFRFLLGYSPGGKTPLIGPGTGLGLCVGPHCVTLEADLLLFPETARGPGGEGYSMRAVNAAVRVQLRPIEEEGFTFGPSLGFVSRIGNVHAAATGQRQLATSLAGRGTLDASFRFAPPAEVTLSAGLDLALSPARWIAKTTVLLEEPVTPFVALTLGMRP